MSPAATPPKSGASVCPPDRTPSTPGGWHGKQIGDAIMSLSLRPLVGLGAAFLTMAMVVIAGMTAPDGKTAMHVATGCRDTSQPHTPTPAGPEAERPA
jgi:hypothetical protein